ncbi:MAG: transposase [Vicinamibacteria bacterium]|jgi:IS5 family transposase|nr:transposase [Vicinamibacteria bacterium]
MFRKTSPQTTLFESQFLVSPEKAARMAKSWAEPFRQRVLPLVDEEAFRSAFCEDNGRPNTSIRLLVGLHLLRDWHDMTDAEVVEQLEYNMLWHHALGVESRSAHVSEKTLWTFRKRLKESDRAREMFEGITRGLAEADGVQLGRQRLDSTHVVPNIAILTRLGLFVETVAAFLKELRRELPVAFATVPVGYVKRYLDREGYFSDAKRSQAPRRLVAVAQDVLALHDRFAAHAAVALLPGFVTLRRLLNEQCKLVDVDPNDANGDGGASGTDSAEGGDDEPTESGRRARVRQAIIREGKEVGGDSLQTPYDTDATYGHKGKGYEVQLSETCNPDNPYQVITAVAVNGAHESDQKALIPMLEQLAAAGMAPMELTADAGYGSGANIVAAAERGVELVARVQDPSAVIPTDPMATPVSEAPAPVVAEAAAAALPSENLGYADFAFDTTCQAVLCCPGGFEPQSQHMAGGQLFARFQAENCAGCRFADLCPLRELANGDRQLRQSPAQLATELRQVEQQQAPFKERYAIRSGVESTNNEIKNAQGLGDLRVRGKAQVDLAAMLKAAALNVKRAVMYHVGLMLQPPGGLALAR